MTSPSRSYRDPLAGLLVALCAALATACSPDDSGPISGTSDTSGGADTADTDDAADAGATDTGEPAEDTCHTITPAPVVKDSPKIAACPGGSPVFAVPAHVKIDKSGGIELRPSGWMQPIGEVERVVVLVRQATGTIDGDANGELEVKAAEGVEVVAKEPVVKGRGAVRVKLGKAGAADIQVGLKGDKRTGKATLHGYASKLPIWRVEAENSAWDKMVATPTERIWVPCELVVGNKKYAGKVRLHGGSSRHYPKKSLRFNLEGSGVPGLGRKLILRAEWRDKSMLRAWLGMSVVRDLTPLPISDASWVHLRRTDGTYLGLMLRVERMDHAFLQKRGLSRFGDFFEADPPFKLAVPGGNLTKLGDPTNYALVYQQHGGSNGHAPLRELIEKTLLLDDEALVAELPEVLDVPRLMLYLAVMAIIQNQDHIKKNYYLHRYTGAADCRWQMLAWDLDLTFGHLWTEKDGLLGETIFTAADPLVGRKTGTLFYNQLIDRALAVPGWRKQFMNYMAELIDRVGSDFVKQRAQAALCDAAPDLVADRSKRAGNDELAAKIDELVSFVQARGKFLSTWLSEQASGAGG